jgi:parvulin-like peptidyl-prolyl isomerase
MYGDLSDSGWVVKGTMDEALDNIAFSIEIGNVSDPILYETKYYIMKVLNRENGPIEETLRQQTGLAEYQKWYFQAYADKVERNPKLDLAEVYAWAVEQLQ